jgi:hypothetical protein
VEPTGHSSDLPVSIDASRRFQDRLRREASCPGEIGKRRKMNDCEVRVLAAAKCRALSLTIAESIEKASRQENIERPAA